MLDLNGSLLCDGRRHFAYDDENQLISIIVTKSTKSEFVYDGKIRRRLTLGFSWQSGI